MEELNQNLKEKYKSKTDANGYLRISDFRNELNGRQVKNIASLLDGEEGLKPEYNLGQDLNYIGSSGDYVDMKIHIDSLDEFIKRINNHYK